MTQWILTSSVLILLVLAVRGLFKNRMKAKYVYALWLIVLVRLLCPVNFGELSFSLLSLAEEGKEQVRERIEEHRTEEPLSSEILSAEPDNTIIYYSSDVGKAQEMESARMPAVAPEMMEELQVVAPEAEDPVPEEKSGVAFSEISWKTVLPMAWIAGMAVMAIIIFGVNISFSTTLGMFRKEIPMFTRKGRGRRKLTVYLADGIYSSCLYGVVHPSIYLNKQGMNDQEKSYCVEHEYSHYLQGDMMWSLCRTLCLILHWYNPLVWLAVLLSKKDAELACDERTIERLGEEERYNYGHTLVELAAGRSKAVQMFGMATLMASNKKEVVERVKAITTKKQTKLITGILVTLLVVGMGFFVFTGEAKGEQDNNNNEMVQDNETPVPTGGEIQEAEAVKSVTTAQTPTYIPLQTHGVKEGKMLVRTPGTRHWQREEGTYVKDEVVYHEAIVNDCFELVPEKGTGWKIDLNGDGVLEYLYLDELRGLFLNGEIAIWLPGYEDDRYWIFDIDTSDGKYEIMLNDTVYYYDGTWFTVCINFGRTPGDGYYSLPGTEIWNFARIDEHTISFYTYQAAHYCVAENKFALNEYHQLVPTEDNEVMYGHICDTAEIYSHRDKAITGKQCDFSEYSQAEYEEIVFSDHVKLTEEKNKGWLADLDGDGTKEMLWISGGWLYVNDYGIMLPESEKTCIWLLDIDTTDGMLEVLTEDGLLLYYNGEELVCNWGLLNYTFGDGCTYQGSLREFVRVDEHTISFRDLIRKDNNKGRVITEATYFLNEHHELVMK